MLYRAKIVLFGKIILQFFNLRAKDLKEFLAPKANQVVVVLMAVFVFKAAYPVA
jgi:hypothetical protein